MVLHHTCWHAPQHRNQSGLNVEVWAAYRWHQRGSTATHYRMDDAAGGSRGPSSGPKYINEQSGDALAPLLPSSLAARMTPAERREHSRRHSRIHARNLSAFFPHPGTDAEAEYEISAAEAAASAGAGVSDVAKPQLMVSAAENDSATLPQDGSRGSTQRRIAKQIRRQSYLLTDTSVPSTPDNFQLYSPEFVGTRQSSGSTSRKTSASWTALPDRGASVSLSATDASEVPEKGASSPYESDSPVLVSPRVQHEPTARPSAKGALFLLCGIPFALGATVWVLGQIIDSLALVGLGYLVVFDTFGLLSTLTSHTLDALWTWRMDNARISQMAADTRGDAEPSARPSTDLRRPFGVRRIETLLFFSECVYLIFAGVYMCKENVEHALLAANVPHKEDRDGVHLPIIVLALVCVLLSVTNVYLRNHGNLAAACGLRNDARSQETTMRREHARRKSMLSGPTLHAGPLQDALMNPFSVTELFFAYALLFMAVLLPPVQVAALDKVVAGLEGAAMLCVAVSAVGPLSKVLLQAAPPASEPQSLQLHRALSGLESHPAVASIDAIKLWQLSPPSLACTRVGGEGLLETTGPKTMQQGPKSASLVATVKILLKRTASAQDCVDVTQLAWRRCAPALGASPQTRAGELLRRGLVAGELTIQVEREGHAVHLETCDHGHEHSHGHDSHVHGDSHGHCLHDHGTHVHGHGAHVHVHGDHAHGHAHGDHGHSHGAGQHEHSGHGHSAHAHAHEHSHGDHGHSHVLGRNHEHGSHDGDGHGSDPTHAHGHEHHDHSHAHSHGYSHDHAHSAHTHGPTQAHGSALHKTSPSHASIAIGRTSPAVPASQVYHIAGQHSG